MLCVWAPPSDQLANSYAVPPVACGEGALTERVDPRIAVRVNGATWLVGPTASDSPAGLDPKVRATVCGSSRRTCVLVRPPASVAVRRSSRYGGDSPWRGTRALVGVPPGAREADDVADLPGRSRRRRVDHRGGRRVAHRDRHRRRPRRAGRGRDPEGGGVGARLGGGEDGGRA